MNKPALVFVPGWGADQQCWQYLEPLLVPHFNCTHCELPFFEVGAESEALASPPELLEQFAHTLPDNSVVVAWSLGGMLATQLAHRFPEKIKRLVLIATNPSFVQRDRWLNAMPTETYQRFYEGFITAPEKTIKRFNALQAQGYADRRRWQKALTEITVFRSGLNPSLYKNASTLLSYLGEIDNTSVLPELTQPVLNIFAENDALVPLAVKDDIERKCDVGSSGCVIESVVIAESGHAPQYTHAEQVFERMSTFLDLNAARYLRDKKKVAQSFAKASSTYDSSSALQLKVAQKLSVCSTNIYGTLLDLGCGTGYCIDALSSNREITNAIGLDIAFSMIESAKNKIDFGRPLQWCNADLESIPFAEYSVDTIISSLAIQWAESLQHVFSEAARVIKKDGRFLVSSLGPLTLNELNRAWQKAEPNFIHVNRFNDACDVMSYANQAGFEVEFFAVDYEVLNYKNAVALMKDLKAIGAHNVNLGSRRGLTGRRALAEVERHYDADRLPNGQLPATYEVYYWVFHKRA